MLNYSIEEEAEEKRKKKLRNLPTQEGTQHVMSAPLSLYGKVQLIYICTEYSSMYDDLQRCAHKKIPVYNAYNEWYKVQNAYTHRK